MPWSIGSYPDTFNSLSNDDKRLAISIANGVYRTCMRDGGTDKKCAPEAIRVALSKVKENNVEETTTTTAEVREAFEDELTLSVSLAEESVEISEDEKGNRLVRVPAVLVESGWSENGRYYSKELLRKSAHLFEGAGSFDGHVRTPKMRDYVGVFHDASFNETAGPNMRGGVTANYCIFDPAVQRVAEHAPHLVRLSIRGKGDVRRGEADGRTGWIVEEFRQEPRWTCDAVIAPGAGGGVTVLEALDTETKEDSMSIESVKDLRESYPEFVKAIEDAKAAQIAEANEDTETKNLLEETQSELSEAIKARDAAQQKVQILESQQVLNEKLAEAKLLPSLEEDIRESFKDRVAEAEAVDTAITRAKALLESVQKEVKVEGVEEEGDEIAESNSDYELLKDIGLVGGDE